MTAEFTLALLAAHLAADFVLQSRRMVAAKRTKGWRRFRGFLLHGLAHFFCAAALLYGDWAGPALIAAAAAILAHLFIDYLKSGLEKRHDALRRSLWPFLIDQALHLSMILAAWWLLGRYGSGSAYLPSLPALWTRLLDFALMTQKERALGALAVALAGTWGAGAGIRLYFLGKYEEKEDNPAAGEPAARPIPGRTGVPEGGFTIGVLERMIVILALLLRLEALIGLPLAVKSIARFKKFDDDRFIEYFIIGSCLSLLAAILAGLLIKRLLFGSVNVNQ